LKKKLKRHEKATDQRGSRHSKDKNNNQSRNGLTTGEKVGLGLGLGAVGITACVLFPEICIPVIAVSAICAQ